MSRTPILPEVQARILAESRRRCALCFGLQRDFARKKGQIAHIDQKASNNDPNNLVFLCFDHHDEYDSTTRKSKGLLPAELVRYRDELIAEVEARWTTSGPLDTPTADAVTPPLVVNVTLTGGTGGPGGMGGGGAGGVFDGGAVAEAVLSEVVVQAVMAPRVNKERYGLRVSRSGEVVLEALISELYARSIKLTALVGAEHAAEFPDHAPMIQARLKLTIEAALCGVVAAVVAAGQTVYSSLLHSPDA